MRVGAERESKRRPAPVCAARRAGGEAHRRAQDGNGMFDAPPDGSVARQLARLSAREQGDDRFEPTGEARRQVGHRDVHDLEVVGPRARRDAEAHPPGEAGRQPGHLFGDERGRPQRQQEWARRSPSGCHGLEEPARELEGVGEVPGETTVVLAGHHPVEFGLDGEPRLRAQLGRIAGAGRSACG